MEGRDIKICAHSFIIRGFNPPPPPPVRGGAVAQSVEHATPGEEAPGSIPAVAARSLLVGSVSV